MTKAQMSAMSAVPRRRGPELPDLSSLLSSQAGAQPFLSITRLSSRSATVWRVHNQPFDLPEPLGQGTWEDSL